MTNTIKGQKIDLCNREHVAIIKFLNIRSKELKKKKLLFTCCRSYGLIEKYNKYIEEHDEMKSKETNLNEKEVKSKIDYIRNELIIECVQHIKKSIEDGDIEVEKNREEYNRCELDEMCKRSKKKI